MTPREAIAFFMSQGWTPAQAAGIVANLVAESNLNPEAVGDGGRAYGIAQWHPDRQANFAKFAGKAMAGSTAEEQLAFVHWELLNTEAAAGDALRSSVTAQESGACVSERYERPADTQGEASRRGALAETLLSQYGVAPEPAEPAPAPQVAAPAPTPALVPQGAPMPLLLSLLPTILGLFAPRVQAAAQKISGQPPDVANQFVQSLFEQLQALTGKPDPIQATAAVQANPDPKVIQQLEDHTLDYLDKIAPMIDRLAKADSEGNAARIIGADAASRRAAQDKWDMTPVLVWGAFALMSLMVIALMGALGWTIYLQKMELFAAVLGLAGPILTLIAKAFGELYAYRFDSTPNSTAKDATLAAIAMAEKR